MRPVLLPIALAGMVATAHADERTTTVTLGASYAARPDATYDTVQPLGGATLSLAWEHAPPPMPLSPGYNTDASLVPELFAGLLADDVHGEFLLGAGVRAEFRIAQREQGLLKVSAKGALYVAARGMVIGAHQDAAGELVVGDYLYISRAARLGIEGGALMRRDTDTMSSSPIFIASAYVGWAL